MRKAKMISTALAALCVCQPVAARDTLWDDFLAPPAAARPLLRWWWFGPAVTDAELDGEIAAMHAGGFGGFEVQTVYPMTVDGTPGFPPNDRYLSDGYIAHLRHAAATGRALGMRVDVTLGSGWPFGGPHVGVDHASAAIRMERVAIPLAGGSITLPPLGPGETRLSAAILAHGDPVPHPVAVQTAFPAARGPRDLLVFVAGHTGQQVKRAANGAEGFVLDHASGAAVADHLRLVGDRLLHAFDGQPPPDAVFSDSLEAYGASWTADLPEQFRKRRGYDLTAHLPALFLDLPDSGAVRYDWARTLSELVDERYLAPIDAWARGHGAAFRAQVYGYPPPTLSSNRLVAIPEGEGANWREFTSTRWATSAAHLYDKPVASSEAWTWLHSPAWAAGPLDMKVEADRHFLQGVTQIVGHGWPYSAPAAAEPGWAFYAAAALNDHNPWYSAMPDVTRYLSRVAFLLRQGRAANGVALYLPTEDAFAAMKPAAASVNDALHEHLPNTLIQQILDAGQGFDLVDAQAVRARALPHRLLVLPKMQRIDDAALAAILSWTKAGGLVVAVGALPQTAGGLRDARAATAVRRMTARLVRMKGVRIVASDLQLTGAIRDAIGADVDLARPDAAIGFVRRTVADGDLYYLANTSNRTVRTTARFAGDRGNGEWWDPMRGTRWASGRGAIAITLAPYESRVLTFRGDATQPETAPPERHRPLDGWTIARPGGVQQPLGAFTSWTESSPHVSGTATYRARFTVEGNASACRLLDFGEATAAAIAATVTEARPAAQLDMPIREAALVTVNGQAAGTVWAPPYRLDISALIRPGVNALEIRVPNSAINAAAGRDPVDPRLLNARYGERFKEQDTDRVRPAPSGLLHPVELVERAGPGVCR